jgi:hypothetical protein
MGGGLGGGENNESKSGVKSGVPFEKVQSGKSVLPERG